MSASSAIDELEFDKTTGKRATHEGLSLSPGDDHVVVRNESHADPGEHEYRVDVADGVPVACSCPAFEYHCAPGEACKHMTRVAVSPAILEVV